MNKKQKKEFIQTPKGMHDLLPKDLRYHKKITDTGEEIAEFYGFAPIKTPHLEHIELFARPLGETSDVVEKQMYTLRTRGGDLLALRPEGTAPAVRAYWQNGMNSLPQPVKLYYEGAFFRHENPQRGRFRELRQFGLEILGGDDSVLDAETIKIFYLILEELGFKKVMVRVNSIGDKECGPTYKKELTNYYKKKFNYLCKDCKRRLKENPLRLLDCKEHSCIEIRSLAPQMIEHLCETCKNHFKEVLEFLDEIKIPYILDHYLVRGFDYYSRTVFEIFIEEDEEKNKENETLAPIAVGGGGRYDELSGIFGSKNLPAVGGSLGMDRVIHEMKRLGLPPKINPPIKVFLIHIGPAGKKRSFTLMEELRAAGINVGESIARDSLKTQLNIAAKIGVKLALILGQKEAMDGTILIRDMDEGIQEVALQSKLVEKIKARLKLKKK